MDRKNINGLIAVGITLGVVGLGYYFLVYTKKVGKSDNFKSLLENLGSTVKPNKDNVVITKFDGGKYLAQFYTNNRVVIFDSANKLLNKGTYSNGGKVINMDDGKSAYTDSVWQNLLDVVK